ncbi:helix-turn-helix domain-containing protein [Bradyrhizobium sp. McL0616]|uniref:helix-turn-helix domain-containing protein n=1 Tax=Bradyrhizobium sp. McL0616 TaxID=3415674 RepID=UPI003CED277E
MLVRIATHWADRRDALGIREFTYNKGNKIYGENEPAEDVYQVRTGTVRRYKVLSDGRRQIGAFHLPGDIFGLENGDAFRFSAEAVVDTAVCLIRRRGLEAVAEADPLVFHNLLSVTTTNLQHAESHLLLLGRKYSMEKVAAFLIEMDQRLSAAGVLSLPMTRRDIADYLGVTIETVSRAVSQLHKEGILDFVDKTQRHIKILNRARLASFDQPS